MSFSPSYADMKDQEHFWLELTPFVAGMNETVCGNIGDQITPLRLFYVAKISGSDADANFSCNEVRIDILERSQEEIESLAGKYPLGFVEFFEGAIELSLKCRNNLVSRMVSTLNLVKNQEIDILVTLPKLPIAPSNVFPVLEYQYRVYSKIAGDNF